jgi:hypothetical protein
MRVGEEEGSGTEEAAMRIWHRFYCWKGHLIILDGHGFVGLKRLKCIAFSLSCLQKGIKC